MFCINTAKPGEAWHHLHPNQRLGAAVPGFGYEFELRMDVRVDYGDSEDCYKIRFWLYDSSLGVETELITNVEYKRRCELAIQNGDTYTTDVHVLHNTERPTTGAGLHAYVVKLESHFRALMALKLFSLPVNI